MKNHAICLTFKGITWYHYYNWSGEEDEAAMFGIRRRKNTLKVEYDPSKQKPVIRCSICTGEQTACLMNLQSGAVTEIMAIQNLSDLQAFQAACGVSEIEKIY